MNARITGQIGSAPWRPHAAGCARIFFVNTLIKSLIVWTLLVAMPFQAFASATILLCAPLPVVQIAYNMDSGHDHAAMLADQSSVYDHAGDNKQGIDHHNAGKCKLSGACCVAAAIAPSHAPHLPTALPGSSPIPFDSGHAPTVDLAFPERPPQSSLA